MLDWSDIRGHQRPLDILERAIDGGRVHHAYLFTGLDGVGKYATAQAFTAIVNCEGRPEGVFEPACGECRSCRKIAGRQHPDILYVEPGGGRVPTIKIAQIREVQQAASRAPYEGRFRMVLVDDAHTMTEEASNALLKTLEEPSERMRLILVTDQPHGLLDTIISRCQVLRFGALDKADVVDLLEAHLEEPRERAVLEIAAGYGEGSVGRALSVIDSGMLDQKTQIIERIVDLPRGESLPLLELAEDLSSNRDQFERNLDLVKLFLRDAMLLQTTGRADRLINQDIVELVERYSQRVTLDDIVELIDAVRHAQRLSSRHVNSQLITEDLLGAFRRRSEV